MLMLIKWRSEYIQREAGFRLQTLAAVDGPKDKLSSEYRTIPYPRYILARGDKKKPDHSWIHWW
jgi:hypothetical protein